MGLCGGRAKGCWEVLLAEPNQMHKPARTNLVPYGAVHHNKPESNDFRLNCRKYVAFIDRSC